MTKKQWKGRALIWKGKFLLYKEKFLDMRDARNIWQKEYYSCKKKLEECEEDPDPQPDKKLAIVKGKLCYESGGTEPIILIGCSRYKALFFSNKQWKDWGVANLEEYESELIKSGINYVRHGICKDMGLLRQHCIKMDDNGIIVEVGLYNFHLKDRMGDYRQAVDATIDLPNVFYDVHNEFCAVDNRDWVREIIKYVNGKGGICGAGAWGHSPHGQEYSERFDPINSANKVIDVHREWTMEWITKYLGHGKPVIRNEYFDIDKNLGFNGMVQIMRETIEAGGQGCQYFMFDSDWRRRLKWAGEYCKRLNT